VAITDLAFLYKINTFLGVNVLSIEIPVKKAISRSFGQLLTYMAQNIQLDNKRR
jgi:hypothetical protein